MYPAGIDETGPVSTGGRGTTGGVSAGVGAKPPAIAPVPEIESAATMATVFAIRIVFSSNKKRGDASHPF